MTSPMGVKMNEVAPMLLIWDYFQSYFVKEIIKLDNRSGTLVSTNIANLVEESTKQSTEFLLGDLLV